MVTLLQQLNREITEVVAKAKCCLVRIENDGQGAGAGTIWHPQGLVLTNSHVAGRGTLRVILADGRTLPAAVLANDTGLDLAALSVTATDLPNIELGDSSRLKPGQLVLALGHPWGVIGAVTAGVVIGSGSQWPELPPSKREWVTVALNVRPGNSGGPLIDVHGRLVGMNTVMTGPEVGLAIPVHVVKRFLQQAVRKSLNIT